MTILCPRIRHGFVVFRWRRPQRFSCVGSSHVLWHLPNLALQRDLQCSACSRGRFRRRPQMALAVRKRVASFYSESSGRPFSLFFRVSSRYIGSRRIGRRPRFSRCGQLLEASVRLANWLARSFSSRKMGRGNCSARLNTRGVFFLTSFFFRATCPTSRNSLSLETACTFVSILSALGFNVSHGKQRKGIRRARSSNIPNRPRTPGGTSNFI